MINFRYMGNFFALVQNGIFCFVCHCPAFGSSSGKRLYLVKSSQRGSQEWKLFPQISVVKLTGEARCSEASLRADAKTILSVIIVVLIVITTLISASILIVVVESLKLNVHLDFKIAARIFPFYDSEWSSKTSTSLFSRSLMRHSN